MAGYKAIWFPYATPKYAFVTWLVAKNRLATVERMALWNVTVNTGCVLCNNTVETREHLFFQCPFSQQVWEELVKGLLLNKFTVHWREVMDLLTGNELDKRQRFLLGYTFQNAMHSLWRERNDRRHGDQPSTTGKLVKIIDKNVCNRISTLANGGDDRIQRWFAARLNTN